MRIRTRLHVHCNWNTFNILDMFLIHKTQLRAQITLIIRQASTCSIFPESTRRLTSSCLLPYDGSWRGLRRWALAGFKAIKKRKFYWVPIFWTRLFGLDLKWGTTLTRSRDRSHSRLESSGYATLDMRRHTVWVSRKGRARGASVATGLQRCTTGLGHWCVRELYNYAFLNAFRMSKYVPSKRDSYDMQCCQVCNTEWCGEAGRCRQPQSLGYVNHWGLHIRFQQDAAAKPSVFR